MATAAIPPTKKIKLKTGMAGINFSHKPGDVIEVPTAQADRHVEFGDADYHVDPPAAAAEKK